MHQDSCYWVRCKVNNAWREILHGKAMVASSMKIDRETAAEKIYSAAFAQK
jgi:hypothetical protein